MTFSQDLTNRDIVRDRAIKVLGTAERADNWLNSVSRMLGGKPAEMADSDSGMLRVLHHLHVCH